MQNKLDKIDKPQIGAIVEFDGKFWEVVHVDVRLTPYRHANQLTTVEGYTLGLNRKKK